MHLTVAICTWNRSTLLAQTLRQATRLSVPDGTTWELLVVDNNCTDDTAVVIESYAGRLPVRRLFQSTPGHSNARNLALQEAAGEYILWTDDDVLVDPQWMAAYVQAFTRRPSAGFFGGSVRPWFAGEPRPWLRRGFSHVAPVYAAVDHGPDEIPLAFQRLPFGANMAFRTADQRAFPYDPTLGLRAGNTMRGEETDVMRRMIAHGVEGWWVPNATVRHYIPPERMSIAYVRRFYMGHGELLAKVDPTSNVRHLFGRPRWMWRAAITKEIVYRADRLLKPPERWVRSLREASVAWGTLRRPLRRPTPRGSAAAAPEYR